MSFPVRDTQPLGWLDLPYEIKSRILVYVLSGIELNPTATILGCGCESPCGTRPSNPACCLPVSKSFADPYEIQRIAMRYGWCDLENIPGYCMYSTDDGEAQQPMIDDTRECLPEFGVGHIRSKVYYTGDHASQGHLPPPEDTKPILAPKLSNLLTFLSHLRKITLNLYEAEHSSSGFLQSERIVAYVPPKFCIGSMGASWWLSLDSMQAYRCQNRLTEEVLINQTDSVADYAGWADKGPPLRRALVQPWESRRSYYPSIFKLVAAAKGRDIKVILGLTLELRSEQLESGCDCNKTLWPEPVDVFFDSEDMSLHIPLTTGKAVFAQDFPRSFWTQ